MKKLSLIFTCLCLTSLSFAFAIQDPSKKTEPAPASKQEKNLSESEVRALKSKNNVSYEVKETKSGTPYSGTPTSGPVKTKKDVVTPIGSGVSK